jgi:predicted site-specific integrase-resolvase
MEAETQSSKFYLVSEAARALDVCGLTIRNWERDGKIRAARTQAGFRIFTDVEIARVRAEREAQAAE